MLREGCGRLLGYSTTRFMPSCAIIDPSTINGKRVVSLYPSGGGTQDYDPDGDWPFVFTEYTLVISEGR